MRIGINIRRVQIRRSGDQSILDEERLPIVSVADWLSVNPSCVSADRPRSRNRQRAGVNNPCVAKVIFVPLLSAFTVSPKPAAASAVLISATRSSIVVIRRVGRHGDIHRIIPAHGDREVRGPPVSLPFAGALLPPVMRAVGADRIIPNVNSIPAECMTLSVLLVLSPASDPSDNPRSIGSDCGENASAIFT